MGPGAAGAILGIESRRVIPVVRRLLLNGNKLRSSLEVGRWLFDGCGFNQGGICESVSKL
jgi:hypothetical protein